MFPFWLAGLVYCISPVGRKYRVFAWMYFIPLLLFIVAQGRGYYLAPAYPMLLAAGLVWFEGCQTPACVSGCPEGVDVPGFSRRMEAMNYAGAARLIREKNPFGEVYGLVYPANKRMTGGITYYGNHPVDDSLNINQWSEDYSAIYMDRTSIERVSAVVEGRENANQETVQRTSLRNVFTGVDLAEGQAVMVESAAAGRTAALFIRGYLELPVEGTRPD